MPHLIHKRELIETIVAREFDMFINLHTHEKAEEEARRIAR